MRRIRVAQPQLSGNERQYVLDCLDSNWISSNGKYIEAFEEEFARYCGVKHAVATSSGTAALHLALTGLGLSAGDEVIVPTLTYIATANAVRYCGATPVLVDVCPVTQTIDSGAVERALTPRTRAIIPVHLYGHPAQMGAIADIARRQTLFVVEDAAEAHGAEFHGRRVGSLGTCAAFSFFGNKIVTTGEGGMITTDDTALAARLRLLRGQGMDPERRYWFDVVGFNYRMTNLQAAIGLAQTERIGRALDARQQLAAWYTAALAPLSDDIVLPRVAAKAKHAFWMFTIWLRHGDQQTRDAVIAHLDRRGIETRPSFYPLHVLPPYRDDTAFPIADQWAGRGISLPTHADVTRSDVRRIAETLNDALTAARRSQTGRTRPSGAAAEQAHVAPMLSRSSGSLATELARPPASNGT